MTPAGCTGRMTGRTPAATSTAGTWGAAGAPRLQGPPAWVGLAAHLQQLHPHQLQPLPLEAPDDLPDQVPLDPVRFDGHEGSFIDPAEGCRERVEV